MENGGTTPHSHLIVAVRPCPASSAILLWIALALRFLAWAASRSLQKYSLHPPPGEGLLNEVIGPVDEEFSITGAGPDGSPVNDDERGAGAAGRRRDHKQLVS